MSRLKSIIMKIHQLLLLLLIPNEWRVPFADFRHVEIIIVHVSFVADIGCNFFQLAHA